MSFTSNGIVGVIEEGVQFVDGIDVFAVSLAAGRTMQCLTPSECLRGRITVKMKPADEKNSETMHATICCMKQTFAGDRENNIHSTLDYYTQFHAQKMIFPMHYVEESKLFIADFSSTANQLRWNEPGLYHCFFRLVHPCVRNISTFPKFRWCEIMVPSSVFPMSDQFIVDVKLKK